MMAALSGSVNIDTLPVNDIEYKIKSYETDGLLVWKSEVSGVDHQMDFRYSYCSVDFDVLVIANLICLQDVCSY
jgi:hypothetical protein